MSFKFSCPHCGQRIGAALEDVGIVGGCPSCQREFVVPAPPEPTPEVAVEAASESDVPPIGESAKNQVARAKVEAAPEPEVPPITRRGVAIVALLLSIFPVINLGALGLAIYAVVRSDRPGRHGERGLAIAAVVVTGLLLVPVNIAGTLVASTTVFLRSTRMAPGPAPRSAPASPPPAKAHP